MDTNININFLDTECRLEGYRINWDHIKGLLETKNLSKRDVANDDLEALCYLKKKRFWLNLEFQKIELSFFYIKDNPSMDVLSTIRGAKEWIMEASPVDWDGMFLCYKQALEYYSLKDALGQAKELYNSLL